MPNVVELMDAIYQKADPGAYHISWWWVGGFIAMGVGFIYAGLWMQFAVDGK
jgi:hypothetical protein